MTLELEADPVRDRACGLTGESLADVGKGCGALIKKGLEHQGEEWDPDFVMAASLKAFEQSEGCDQSLRKKNGQNWRLRPGRGCVAMV